MDIEASKIELIKLILKIDNDKSIKKLKEFIINESSDFWDELSLDEQAQIKEGIDQLNKGIRTSYSEVLNEIS